MVALICGFLFAVAVTKLLAVIGHVRGFETEPLLLRYAFLALGVIVALVVHECGHRTTGALMRWKLVRFGFGPFEFYLDRKLWKRMRVKMLWGAFVRQLPPDLKNFRQQKALTLISGPLASLSGGAVFLAIAMATESSMVYALFSRFGLVALLGAFELIPAYRDGIGSDGYRLLQVLRGGKHLDEMYREICPETSNFTKVRYRDWPSEALTRMAATDDDPYTIYLAYLRASDAGETDAATAYMRRLIALMPHYQPYVFFAYEAAYWLTTEGGDIEEARRWLDRAGRDMTNVVCVEAEAAIASAEGQSERVADLVRQGLALAPDPDECGSDAIDVERLQRVLANSRAGKNALLAADERR
jgi:hypothetical protein